MYILVEHEHKHPTNLEDRKNLVKRAGESLITEDGEAIEGEALDDVIVHGVVTFTINRVSRDDGAV